MLVLFLSKALMCSQSQVKEVEEENSKLQLQVKELNEEYRARLVCYLQDLAVSCSIHTCMSPRPPLPALTSISFILGVR